MMHETYLNIDEGDVVNSGEAFYCLHSNCINVQQQVCNLCTYTVIDCHCMLSWKARPCRHNTAASH